MPSVVVNWALRTRCRSTQPASILCALRLAESEHPHQRILAVPSRLVKLTCVFGVLLATVHLNGVSHAQQGDGPPTLPETEVEAAPATLPETTVEAAPQAQGFVDPNGNYDYDPVLDGSMFSAPVANSYRAAESTTGSIIAVPDADIPATVNVVTQEVMQDQITLSLDEVIRNAGGVVQGGDSLFADRLFLRGLELQSRDFRRDGFLDPTFVPRDFQSIERVEILKGPASALYGAGSPAGVVNLITKKPIDTQFSDFAFTFGAWERARYTIDTNGRATQSGNVLYRINAAHEDAQSFRDFDFLSRTLIAPGATWEINPSTRITYQAEWHRDHRRGDQGIPVLGNDPLALPIDRYVGEPANDFIHYEEFRQTLMLTHELSDNWTFNVGGYSLFYEFPASVTAATTNPPPIGPFFFRSRTDIPLEDEQSQSFITNLAGDFYTGGFRHRLVTGLEYVYFDSNSLYNFSTLPPIDVTNPVYTNPPPFPGSDFTAAFPVFRQQRVGWYAQDLIDLNDYWKAVAGVRIDTVDFEFEREFFFSGFPIGGAETEQNFTYTTPRGGLIYQPYADDTLAFYYTYGQSFSPPGGGVYINPNPLRPILGEIHEAGVKTLLLPNLSLNAAGFYIKRRNADLNTGAFFLTQVGEERSQGAEVNLLGQINDRWSAIANYTYADVRLFDDFDPTLDGNRQRNVPYNTANFWTRYNVIQNDVHTIGAAIGLVYLDSRPGDLQNTFELPSYGRWDGGLYYERGPLYASCFIENLFDVEYASSSIDRAQVFPGAPFNARASVGYVW
jgi:iron complex outermembrane recepter protein